MMKSVMLILSCWNSSVVATVVFHMKGSCVFVECYFVNSFMFERLLLVFMELNGTFISLIREHVACLNNLLICFELIILNCTIEAVSRNLITLLAKVT